MGRGIKKFIYGLFYISIASLSVFLIYRSYTTIPPTCFDNIQNQTETGIDCGGTCVSCEIKNLIPITQASEPLIFSNPTSGGTIVVFEVENQNSSHHATKFDYVINVFNPSGIKIETLSGSDALFANEKHYIYEPNIGTPKDNVGKISLDVLNPQWEPSDTRVPPELTIGDIKTGLVNGGLKVTGTIKNGNTFKASNVKIVAIIRNKNGFEFFASQIILTSIKGFETALFTVTFPSDKTLIDDIDPNGTKVFVSSQ
ncbi:MAG: hypothetical protein WCO21_00105 [bacterium]